MNATDIDTPLAVSVSERIYAHFCMCICVCAHAMAIKFTFLFLLFYFYFFIFGKCVFYFLAVETFT